ncbi:MAG: hypothetical protein KAJ07_04885 [Planctomycetes bacterium]|nr:hypothetical protein [Planctomycetota bacterium]
MTGEISGFFFGHSRAVSRNPCNQRMNPLFDPKNRLDIPQKAHPADQNILKYAI